MDAQILQQNPGTVGFANIIVCLVWLDQSLVFAPCLGEIPAENCFG